MKWTFTSGGDPVLNILRESVINKPDVFNILKIISYFFGSLKAENNVLNSSLSKEKELVRASCMHFPWALQAERSGD